MDQKIAGAPAVPTVPKEMKVKDEAKFAPLTSSLFARKGHAAPSTIAPERPANVDETLPPMPAEQTVPPVVQQPAVAADQRDVATINKDRRLRQAIDAYFGRLGQI
jgi:hypothetical protein